MRVLIYGTLAVLAALLVTDTNIGMLLQEDQQWAVRATINHLSSKKMTSDADLAARIADSGGFRESRVYGYVVQFAEARRLDFSFYAYTPLLSGSKVFIGGSFWDVGTIGRSSVLIHELAHITRHKNRLLGGFPRSADEAQAYRRQYLTYSSVELSPSADGVVYWNMMIGIHAYVLPAYPEYRDRPDIRSAMRGLEIED